MKANAISTLFFLIISIGSIQAQKIEIEKKGLGGTVFYQNGNKVSMGDLQNIMQDNVEALASIKKARSNNVLAQIIGAAGGLWSVIL